MQLTLKIRDIPDDGANAVQLSGPLPPAIVRDGLAGQDADLAATSIAVRMELLRSGDTITLHGQLSGDVKLPCSRCLEEAHLALAQRLHVILGPGSIGAEDSLEDEIEYFNHDGETVQLEPVLRESLMLSLPMVVLCRPDCLGLCPVCGGNRNLTPCGCEAERAARAVDPRLEKLAVLARARSDKPHGPQS